MSKCDGYCANYEEYEEISIRKRAGLLTRGRGIGGWERRGWVGGVGGGRGVGMPVFSYH